MCMAVQGRSIRRLLVHYQRGDDSKLRNLFLNLRDFVSGGIEQWRDGTVRGRQIFLLLLGPLRGGKVEHWA